MNENEKNPIEIMGEVVEEKEVNENTIETKADEKKKNDEAENIIEMPEIVIGDDNEINGINISEDVVATIAGIAASEVNGVASMNGGFVGGLSEMLGKKTKGVKVQIGDKETVIDINLTIEYGARIPDIAWEVQNKVKTQVESMTGFKGVVVNIHVQGISLPKKNKQEKVNQESEKEE